MYDVCDTCNVFICLHECDIDIKSIFLQVRREEANLP